MNPGIYDDVPDDVYHADKASLSVSGAKRLLPPSCPAKFQHEREHGPPTKPAWDLGKAAHAEVLGTGAEVVVIDAPGWTTKAAREARDEAYAAGKVPLLAADKARVQGMAAALRRDPTAAALFDPEHGKAEQSGYWTDEETGVPRRFRLDWLPDTDGGRLIVPDYKSCTSASRSAIAKAAATYGYYMQHPWYVDGCTALGLAADVVFLFVFQETTPPYLTRIVQLYPGDVDEGRRRNRRALEIFRDCTESGIWPGYSTEVDLISLPRWAYYDEDIAS